MSRIQVLLLILACVQNNAAYPTSPFAVFANQLVSQIIPPGKPWPSNAAGYVDQSTQPPVVLVTQRFGEKPTHTTEELPWVEFNVDEEYWIGSVQKLPFE